MTIALIGAKGMLGSNLSKLLKSQCRDFVALDIDEIDITKREITLSLLAKIRPDIIINCAAYTNVDGAEVEKELAFSVNHTGPKNLAEYSSDKNIPLCHISTDYVFDGKKTTPYREDDHPSPLGVYGLSKLAGEEEIRKIPRYYIIRTAWLYGINGKNFVTTILKAAKEKDKISVINDQLGSPTYTADLAKRIMDVIERLPFGIYHATNMGVVSWFDLATAALKIAKIITPVVPIRTEEYPSGVTRPKYSVLSNEACLLAGLPPMPDWKDALTRFIKNEFLPI